MKVFLNIAAIIAMGGLPAWSDMEVPPQPPEPTNEMPQYVKAVFAKEAPGFTLYEWLREEDAGGEVAVYRMGGKLNEQVAEIEVELDANKVPLRLEIHYETDPSILRLQNRASVAVSNLPSAVTAEALSLVPGLEVTSAHHGVAGIVDAYDIKGQSGDFSVFLKMLSNGTPLKLEKERD